MADPETDTQNQQQEPELIFGKYKSLEEAEKAYKEAERKIHEQGQKLSEMDEQLESLTELAASLQQHPQQAPQQTGNPLEDLVAQYEQAAEMGDVRTQLAINAQIGALAAQSAIQQAFQQQQPQWQQLQQSQTELVALQATNQLRSAYQDWEQYEDRVAQTIEKNPTFTAALQAASTPAAFAAVLDTAYKAAKFEDLAAAQTQQQQSEAAKLAAQTVTGAGPARISSPDADKAEWERIVQAGRRSPWTT